MKQKLKLTWIDKEKHPHLEPRIFLDGTKKFEHGPLWEML